VPASNVAVRPREVERRPGFAASLRPLLLVIAAAFCVRLLFGALTHDTYDYDEFVISLLSRDLVRGATAYRDFMFFHPPGVLLLFGALQPLISHWWPSGRLLMMLVDAGSAGLVFRLGTRVWGQREGLVAALLYSVNPLALISAVRINQDSLITFLGLLGLVLLLERKHLAGEVLAGVCLGLAIWMKYPAALFGPVYLLAAPRRVIVWGAALLVTLAVVFAPFLGQAHALYQDTVAFQRARWLMPAEQRFGTTAIYWLGINLPGLWGLMTRRQPLWLIAGFLLGGVFALSSQVYYHYFVPIVPFGSLLAAPVLCHVARYYRPLAASVALAIVLAWAALIDLGGPSPLYVTAARLSSIEPTVRWLDRHTASNSTILADRDEYAFLAHRNALDHYFWNVGVLVNAQTLEARLPAASAVVLSHGASSGYPAGFVRYLNRHYHGIHVGATRVWLIHGK
jgi:hypothetical protein